MVCTWSDAFKPLTPAPWQTEVNDVSLEKLQIIFAWLDKQKDFTLDALLLLLLMHYLLLTVWNGQN